MSFEVIPAGQFGTLVAPIEEGWASVAASGKLTLRAADLELAGIRGDFAVVLADRSSLRVAVRAPRDGEEVIASRLSIVKAGKRAGGKDSGRRSLNITRALKALNLTPEAVKGRFELATKGEGRDALLILNLLGIAGKGGESGKGSAGAK